MSAASSSRGAWSPLASTLFRWLWIASIASNVGTWMQNVGAAWLMTSLAPSALYVALVQTATNLPVFLLGMPAGAVADVIDRRRLLIVTQAWMLAAAGLLGIFTLAGVIGPWLLLFLTFALGLGATMNGPAWQAILSELVPSAELSAAISLNSVGFNLARAVGPALGGLVVAATSPGIAFLLNAASFVGVIIVLYRWRRAPDANGGGERVASAILAGMRYIRFAPPVHAVLVRCGVFVVAASALWAILPVVAKQELHSESTGYGVLLGCLGVGSILAAALLARLRARLSTNALVAGGSILFGLVNLALSWLQQFAVVCAVLVIGGMAWMTVMSSFTIATQTAVPAWVRARALGAYMLMFQGGMALGSVAWGMLASRVGLRTALFAAGVALLAGWALSTRFRLHQAEDFDTTPSLHWPEPNLVVKLHPDRGPVLVTVEYRIDPSRALEFARAMQHLRRIRRRDGAKRWGLFEDASVPGRFLESFLVESWAEHLRQHERITVSDRAAEQRANAFHTGPSLPSVTHWIAAE